MKYENLAKKTRTLALNHSALAAFSSLATNALLRCEQRNTVVADERTNAILISGDPKVRARLKRLIRQLDVEMATKGNNLAFRVFGVHWQAPVRTIVG